MPTVFDELDRAAVKKLLDAAIGPLLPSNRLFMQGEHWQGSDGWLGPRLLDTDPRAAVMLSLIELNFISRNIIAEVTERHTAGVLSWEPTWGYTVKRPVTDETPVSDAEAALIDEVEAPVTTWWDRRRAWRMLLQMTRTMLWAEAGDPYNGGSTGDGRAGLRLYIPRGRVADISAIAPAQPGEPSTGVALAAPTLEAALDLLYLEQPAPEASYLLTHPDTQEQCALILYEDSKKKQTVELYYLVDPLDAIAAGAPLGPDGAPLQRNTVIRVIGPDGESRIELPLGGKLPFHEVRRPLLVTVQVQSGQKAFNLALTMIPRNLTQASFLETTFFNAMMPGDWEVEEGRRIKFTPTVYERGPGKVNFVRGLDYVDEQGITRLTTPSVDHRPPAGIEPVVTGKSEHYADILDECDQLYVLLGDQAAPSGKSRAEARADGESNMQESAQPVEEIGRWLLETLLVFAEALLGEPGRWSSQLRAEFTCHISIGPITPEEQDANDKEQKAGRLSRETTMERNGVRDVAAEMQRIEAEEDARFDFGERLGKALTSLTSSGLTLADAGAILDGEDVLTVLQRASGLVEDRSAQRSDALAAAAAAAAANGAPGVNGNGGEPANPAIGAPAGARFQQQ